jgi:4-alpha-glucanotransferase
MRMGQRNTGILLHIASLFNRFSIGDLGPSADAFVDFMGKSGPRWWQMLPIADDFGVATIKVDQRK